jgi:hypothetical protein
MGQYWIIVNITKRQWIDCYSFNCSKMMEFAWIGDPYLLAIENTISQGGRWQDDIVWFEGDYNQPTNLYSQANDSWECVVSEGLLKHHKYVVNRTQKEFVDIEKSGNGIHPLPILLAHSSGVGGGDYCGNDMELVGSWVGDVVSCTVQIPDGYTELEVDFTE